MTSANKKNIIGGLLLTGGMFYTIRYGTQRFRGYMSYDNYGTRYIGPQQLTGNIDYSSLIASGDNVDFDNLPAKTLGIAVAIVGLYIIFKKTTT